MRRAAPEAAAAWLKRALAEDAPEPPRAVLLHELGRVELASREPAAIAHLQEALELVAEPVARARVALDLSEILVAAGLWESGLAVMSDALTRLGEGDHDVMVDLEVLRALLRAFDPRIVAAFDADRGRLLRLAAGPSWSARALAVLIASIGVLRGESLGEARGLVEHGLRDWQLFAEHDAGGWASSQALMALTLVDADARALEVIDELAVRALRAGALIGTLTAMGHRCWISARRGDLAPAEDEMRTCMDVSVQNGMSLLIVSGAVFFVDAMLERPSLSDLAEIVEQVELTPDFLATCGGAMLLEARGRLRIRRGDRDGGIADLRACGQVYAGLRFGPPLTFWRSELALALPADARDEALALITLRAHARQRHRPGPGAGDRLACSRAGRRGRARP